MKIKPSLNFLNLQYKAENKVSCSRTQHSVSDESQTSDPSTTSLTLFSEPLKLLSLTLVILMKPLKYYVFENIVENGVFALLEQILPFP